MYLWIVPDWGPFFKYGILFSCVTHTINSPASFSGLSVYHLSVYYLLPILFIPNDAFYQNSFSFSCYHRCGTCTDVFPEINEHSLFHSSWYFVPHYNSDVCLGGIVCCRYISQCSSICAGTIAYSRSCSKRNRIRCISCIV